MNGILGLTVVIRQPLITRVVSWGGGGAAITHKSGALKTVINHTNGVAMATIIIGLVHVSEGQPSIIRVVVQDNYQS